MRVPSRINRHPLLKPVYWYTCTIMYLYVPSRLKAKSSPASAMKGNTSFSRDIRRNWRGGEGRGGEGRGREGEGEGEGRGRGGEGRGGEGRGGEGRGGEGRGGEGRGGEGRGGEGRGGEGRGGEGRGGEGRGGEGRDATLKSYSHCCHSTYMYMYMHVLAPTYTSLTMYAPTCRYRRDRSQV